MLGQAVVDGIGGCHQERAKRGEELFCELERVGGHASKRDPVLLGEDFGHNLTEKEDERGDDYGLEDELYYASRSEVDERGREVGREHDNRDVDEIVGYQDCREKPLRLAEESHDEAIILLVAFCERLFFFWGEGEHGDFATGSEATDEE